MRLLNCTDLRRTAIQLAASGQWEKAITASHSNVEAVKEWIAAAGEDVAIESLYCDRSGQWKGFVGYRRKLVDVEERCRFWLDLLAASRQTDFNEPKEQLLCWLVMVGQPSMLNSAPEGSELGVFNQWFSSVPISMSGDRLTDKDLKDGPDWVRNGANAPICREYYWREPEQIWVADVVSHIKDGRFVVDRSLLPA